MVRLRYIRFLSISAAGAGTNCLVYLPIPSGNHESYLVTDIMDGWNNGYNETIGSKYTFLRTVVYKESPRISVNTLQYVSYES